VGNRRFVGWAKSPTAAERLGANLAGDFAHAVIGKMDRVGIAPATDYRPMDG